MSDAELVVREAATPTLFGTDQPHAVIAKVSEVATALAMVIKKQNLFMTIRGKAHILVDGWVLCGTMLGVFPVVVETHELHDPTGEIIGFEARVEARTKDGSVVGGAVARCTRDEKRWSTADDYAILSMSQTRGVSKAMRGPLGFIVSMAGYSPTPAEEMPSEADSAALEHNPPSDAQANMIRKLADELGHDMPDLTHVDRTDASDLIAVWLAEKKESAMANAK